MKTNEALLRINNGLVLNGNIRLQSAGSLIGFEGDETVSGTGSILFETIAEARTGLEMATAGTLTIGNGVTLEGGRATIGGVKYPNAFWGQPMDLVNQGTIRANTADQTIIIEVRNGTFENQGTLDEQNGGTIILP